MLQELMKMDKKLQKNYLTYFSLLIAHDLWQSRYQILSIMFLKEFVGLNVNLEMIKKSETYEIRYNHWDRFLEYINLKDGFIEHKCLCCNKNYQCKFDENLKERFFNTYKFSNHNNSNFIS